ncbi:MAG: phosphopyruvate hydratase [Pseudomonadota bacterium]|nr:phosphopyruvate hydratase [Pseudomonadota bacterium]
MEQMKIKNIRSFEILDSRGTPTVMTSLELEDGTLEFGYVPSGASTGSREAIEKRDGGNSFDGKGLNLTIKNATDILFPELIGMELSSLFEFDAKLIELDGSVNKEHFGANILLSLSLAACKALSSHQKKPLYLYINEIASSIGIEAEIRAPLAMMNILNGGAHANNGLDIQEFMIQPSGFSTFKESIICGVEVFQELKKILSKKGFSTAVGDEGGFAPNINSSEEALNLISEAISSSGYIVDDQVTFALDCASTEIYEEGVYNLNGESLSSSELIKFLESLSNKFPLTSIEDPLDENDWNGWVDLTNNLGDKLQIVGDDLFVTNKLFLKKGIELKAGNSILIKINQIGSLSETLETIKLAKDNNYNCIISHRSGETEDNFISDLVVGTGLGQIKTGAPSRSDRTSKYNRLLYINELENLNFRGKKEIT